LRENPEEEQQRIEEFGKWLEDQEEDEIDEDQEQNIEDKNEQHNLEDEIKINNEETKGEEIN